MHGDRQAEPAERNRTGEKILPKVVRADIAYLPTNEIFDLRVHKDLCEFQKKIRSLFDEANSGIKIDGIEDETKRIITLRSILIDYYARMKNGAGYLSFNLLQSSYRIPLRMEESYEKKKTVKGTYN